MMNQTYGKPDAIRQNPATEPVPTDPSPTEKKQTDPAANAAAGRNRLAKEQSPYLLQHAENPVHWYPWCSEAFAQAKERDLPIFLSIGYSTCHWCHVMAHESFEDNTVAAQLNQHFVPIKVDREERPDIDAVYMRVCQMLTGSGGWPLTVLLTPDQKPFWAGTYLPKTALPGTGIPGLTELLNAVADQWKNHREKLLQTGAQITEYLLKSMEETKTNENRPQPQRNSKEDGSVPSRPQALSVHADRSADPSSFSRDLLQRGAADLLRIFDRDWGGFGRAPKFPAPHNLLFLLAYSRLEKNTAAEEAVRYTLDQMYRGGLFDHIGGGFSRYATDRKWLVPHFEKMLYDNGLLTLAYLEYYHVSQDAFYATVARRTMDYVLRELTAPSGGFYCGQDADSDGVEGKFYVFTPDEIRYALGQADGTLFCRRFGITDSGNFEGKSIPNLLETCDYTSTPLNFPPLLRKMRQFREKRTALHKDDKILTSWNGLMIAAFARAYGLLGDPVYLNAAEKAAAFLHTNLTDKNGRLLIRWRNGHAAHLGQLDDYAFFAFGLLELYRATLCTKYLTDAISLAEKMVSHFSDREYGGLFLYSDEGEQLIYRPKESYDGAMPSGNSTAALVFVRLFSLTGEIKWKKLAESQCSWLADAAAESPAASTFGLCAMTELLYPSTQLICVSRQEEIPEKLTAFLRDSKEPNLTVILKHPGNADALASAAPFTASYPIPEGGALYYFCENGTCSAPVVL